ncbi:MAG: HupE/UreJ family protein [Chthoniobacter sp.]|uniref:HupE/UreJ family protein n=1 Tax=Chthoniobacter sp. TaxID=2510640 RepID=UPI0032A66BC2
MIARTRSSFTSLATLSLALAPVLAQAHPGHDASGFAAGVSHPVHGLDHILAMVAVGLWAVQLGGRAKWLVPASFVSVMAIGGALGMAGVAMPFAEQGILASVLILGVLIAAAVRLPLAASMTIVGLFALCHGQAHGLEMPGTAAGLSYGAGFVIATALLHTSGIMTGLMIQRFAEAKWVRATGVAICTASAFLALN